MALARGVSKMFLLPSIDDDDGPLRDVVTVAFIVFKSSMRKPNRRDDVPACEFLHDRVDVWQAIAIVEVWKACPSDDSIQFSLRLPLDIGIHRHREEECSQGGHSL